METVLLSGVLNREVVEKAKNEIDYAAQKTTEINLIVKSNGGHVVPVIDLINTLNDLRNRNLKFSVKIYEAQSMAAVLALSIRCHRSMSQDTTIGLHRGSLQLEATDFDLETGQISDEILDSFRKYSKHFEKILKEYGISNNKSLITVLYATNWIQLTPAQCLGFSIISELF